jgi:hypothetical protein
MKGWGVRWNGNEDRGVESGYVLHRLGNHRWCKVVGDGIDSNCRL